MTPEQRNEIRNLSAKGDLNEAICRWLGYGELFARLGGIPPEIAAAVHAIKLELAAYADRKTTSKAKAAQKLPAAKSSSK